ncbi:ABC transporter ATP-binding protein [Paraburkholderia aspalathi]|uniref:Amino acid/amide ABC transporter ATP-binding protein 2, HAAT family n=1 Tax=Paraburkholderia aspalathi TaxID=1324617 RepID=A0A1I7ERG3_9BURK|nr:ABC transporter ATP-binding protein [Paraburkholderia aspalathi]SFU26507.1 amino acid/amide ABC transporter ATP-binding protein 2, HAAT family [Paraburkholderia aspalathi]
MPTLETQSLVVRYGQIEAVRDATFRVENGEIVALIGSNGAGKSSTLKAVMGIIPTANGKIYWDDEPIQALGAARRVVHGIALSPEGRRLFPYMSVLENLLVGAHTVRSRIKIRTTLELVYALFPRVAERRRQQAGSLSGGEQQMVAIGRALMAQPKLLMLDEPSLGIAPKIVAEIADAIERLNQEMRLSVLLVEQNARLALKLSRRAYVFEQGSITRTGTGAELLADPMVQKAYLGL